MFVMLLLSRPAVFGPVAFGPAVLRTVVVRMAVLRLASRPLSRTGAVTAVIVVAPRW
jgi:hypothetical protein